MSAESWSWACKVCGELVTPGSAQVHAGGVCGLGVYRQAVAQQPPLGQTYGQPGTVLSYGLTQGQQQAVREPQPHPKLSGLTARLARLLVHRDTLETYSKHRMEDRDRHAVSDAANDLRELECEIRCVEEMIDLVGGEVA